MKDFLQRSSLILAAAALLLAVSSCKKNPSAAQTAPATQPVPAIAASGTEFGGAGWEAQKVAHDQNASAGAGQSYAHVTYKPEVKIIDEGAVLSSIVGVSSNGHGAVFNNASAEIRALKAGDIFMVKNDFAVKILGAETDGNQTVVLFDNAKLTDIVQQGVIHLDTPISFHGPAMVAAATSPRRFHFMDLIETPVYAQNGTGEGPAPGALQPGFNTPKDGVDGG
ncbi:MAG: hypothetical protein WA634_13100, partial [Silvibacterium sp.]